MSRERRRHNNELFLGNEDQILPMDLACDAIIGGDKEGFFLSVEPVLGDAIRDALNWVEVAASVGGGEALAAKINEEMNQLSPNEKGNFVLAFPTTKAIPYSVIFSDSSSAKLWKTSDATFKFGYGIALTHREAVLFKLALETSDAESSKKPAIAFLKKAYLSIEAFSMAHRNHAYFLNNYLALIHFLDYVSWPNMSSDAINALKVQLNKMKRLHTTLYEGCLKSLKKLFIKAYHVRITDGFDPSSNLVDKTFFTSPKYFQELEKWYSGNLTPSYAQASGMVSVLVFTCLGCTKKRGTTTNDGTGPCLSFLKDQDGKAIIDEIYNCTKCIETVREYGKKAMQVDRFSRKAPPPEVQHIDHMFHEPAVGVSRARRGLDESGDNVQAVLEGVKALGRRMSDIEEQQEAQQKRRSSDFCADMTEAVVGTLNKCFPQG